MAVVEASKDIIAQCCSRAAALWSTDEDMVEWRDGAVHPSGSTSRRRPYP